VGGHEVFTSLSAGVAIMRPDYTDADQILRDASVALSRAKERGGAGYVIFDPEMHDEAVQRLRLERDLHRAVERQEFQAFYQPVLRLADGSLEGFEALVRWNHPDYGIVSPGQFIPLAEDTGLIQSLGRWIVEEGCRQLGAWQAEFTQHGRLAMNVNLSPRQLRDPQLVTYVEEAITRNGLASGDLKLEFTESAMMEDPEATPSTLEELRQKGATICLDDFGTGYSSLSYLHDLPVDVLKIDRSFVERLSSSERGLHFIQAIVDLAYRLGLTIVAEGIEEAEQEAALQEMGCQLGQGFLYSRPVTAEEARFQLLQP
jgi:EAL domain-containing protein (putative c-di-GMP-specific phosphodiesterase class I)